MSEDEYRRVALSDPHQRWELVDGRLRGNPPMSVEHGDVMSLDPYERILTAWVRHSEGNYAEKVFAAGAVRLSAMPGAMIDLDALFDA